MSSFTDFALLPTLTGTLKELTIHNPTEIQKKAIPIMLSKKAIVGVSETGSGKTLAFVLPILHILKTLEMSGNAVKEKATPRALVITPTRELGEQVSKVFKSLTHHTRLRVRTALGGQKFEQSRRNIDGPFEVLLATPGRLLQLMERQLIHLSDIHILIFDEADQMLDEGFMRDSKLIHEACPKELQMGLFSATVSKTVQQLMTELFAGAEVVRSAGSGKVVATLTTQNCNVIDGKRWTHLERILSQKVKYGTLMFTNTKDQCDKLTTQLHQNGHKVAPYRGEMSKNERRTNLKKFREGQVDILVSTDLASRGLDLENIGRVINYHLPKEMENYIHRVGRTARAGRTGLVINMVTERDAGLMAELDRQT